MASPGALLHNLTSSISLLAMALTTTLAVAVLVREFFARRKRSSEIRVDGERLRLALEAGKAVGWDWDVRSGRDVWFGDLQTMFGIPGDLYEGYVEDFRRRVHPDDRELVWRAVAEARQNRTVYRAKFRLVWPDGTLRWAAASGQFYYSPSGEAVRMLGIAADITASKVTEDRLRESQEWLMEARTRLGAIVESSNDSIISLDLDGAIVSWNAAAQRTFGFTADEVVGQSIAAVVPPGLWAEEQRMLARIKAGDGTEHYETLRMKKDGRPVIVSLTISPIRDAEGHVVGASEIARDVTDRKHAEEALRESEERFRLMADTAAVMLWVSGPDKLCNYVNRAWLEFTGRTFDTELGNGWTESVHPRDLQHCLDTYERSFDAREPFKMEYRVRRADGVYRWVLDSGVPRFAPDGSFTGYIGSVVDVADQKFAEELRSGLSRKLMEAQESERTWIARELHDDVAQRVAVLTMDLNGLMKALPTSATDLRSKVEELNGSVVEIGRDVQAISHRLHSSKLEYLGVAAAAAAFCRELADQQHVEIDFSHDAVPEGLPKEVGLGLFRVLQEALTNAVKHAGVRRFTVALRGAPDHVQLDVIDCGVGFNPRTAMRSHGLGLISMHERLSLVNGEVAIESKPGEGTRVRVRVPLGAADDSGIEWRSATQLS
jgi:PAS domain S-box-containing protein